MSKRSRLSAEAQEGLAGNEVTSPPRRKIRSSAERKYTSSFSLRGCSAETVLLITYLVLSRFSIASETSFGVTILGVPIFLTDVVILTLILLTAVKQPARLVGWVISGTGAGIAGVAIWGICLIGVCYFLLALGDWGVLALRDLGMFGYAVFFTLSYMAIDSRQTAVKLLWYLTYGVLVPGLALFVQIVTGLPLGIYDRTIGFAVASAHLQRAPTGDLSSNLGFSLAALLAFIALDRERRFNVAAALICGVGIAASLNRSSVLSLLLAALVTLVFVGRGYRLHFGLYSAGAAVAILFALRSGVGLIQDIYLASVNPLSPLHDADLQFRLFRWRYSLQLWSLHPVLGIGFGPSLAPWDPSERGGVFNIGMPHNAYITVLARMGMLGLVLFAVSIGNVMVRLIGVLAKGSPNANDLAAANILSAMLGFAALNLFFERPLLCGPFWIMLAVAMRLAETSTARAVSFGPLGRGRRSTAGRLAMIGVPEPV